MKQEDKELVLKDLSSRFPYGVHVEISWKYSKADVHKGLEYYEFPNIDSLLNIFWDKRCISIKPYLRPMSSMTEEEIEILEDIRDYAHTNEDYATKLIDFYNSHHLDYRGLIPEGLALEAPEGMYDLKKK